MRDAVKLEPENAFAKRNLAAVLMRAGRAADPGAQLGLAQCLEELGPSHVKEAAEQYKAVVKRFPDHQAGEMAERRSRASGRRRCARRSTAACAWTR